MWFNLDSGLDGYMFYVFGESGEVFEGVADHTIIINSKNTLLR
jgi:hypothetical protein